jgi:hypothetical protein
MTYEKFKTIIETLETSSEKSSALYKLGVDLMDYTDSYQVLISLLLKETFGETGADWIDWYLYERPSFKDTNNHAWDENGKAICYDIPSLWETVKEYM